MSIEKLATSLPACFELRPPIFRDSRGEFIKTFHRAEFDAIGLHDDWVEQFYSVSKQGVLRGMHFQLPPKDHAKLVYCTAGEVLDVAVDLRKGSPCFGQHTSIVLSAAKGNMLYLPSGIAHGFYTLSESATLVYNVTSVHSPLHDAGIRWDSLGINWPSATPKMSDRDRALPPFVLFESPFRFSIHREEDARL